MKDGVCVYIPREGSEVVDGLLAAFEYLLMQFIDAKIAVTAGFYKLCKKQLY